MARRRWWLVPLLAVVVALVLVLLPPFLPPYYLSMITKVLIFAIFALSLDLVLGYTGLLSLGHASFLGVAGYTAGVFMTHYHVDSFWLLVPLAVLAAGVAAAIIGYLVLRVSGVYFLLVTLGFGQLLSILAVKWRSVTGGTDGLVGILYADMGIPGLKMTSLGFYYLVFVAFVIAYFLLHRLTGSPFGRTLVGIRENEERMQCLGYNTWAHKYAAFIIGGLFAGLAGVLFAQFYGAMVPGHLGLITSTSAMLMVIIGGAGTLFGPVLGATVIVLLERFASIYSPERWPLILGAVFVISVLFLRGGFGYYLKRFWDRVRR